jgi:two-component system response regulator PfeR
MIEDDPLLAEHLQGHLHSKGFEVTVQNDGEQGLQLAQAEKFDLILLDILLPERNGLDVLSILRQEKMVPVIIMSALGSGPDRIAGFSQGADDYLPKPFSLHEMDARIDAVLRRVAFERGRQPLLQVSHSGLKLDESRQDALYANTRLNLTATEYRLLTVLMEHAEEILSKAFLCQHALNRPFAQSGRSLDMHVSHVRRKLQRAGYLDSRIETVWGKGYVLTRRDR